MMSVALQADQLTTVELLNKQLRTMTSLQANFSQIIKDDKGEVLQAASGTVNVKRPRRLHWLTTEPYEHLVVTDGNTLWLYDIDLEQVSRQAFSADLDKAPALLLGGEIDQIISQYEVRIVPAAKTKTDIPASKLTQFELMPLKGSGLFSRLTIAFNDGKLASMSLQDSFDQNTLIEFSNVKLNPVIDDKLFQFTAPDGIDVINND